MLPHASCVHPTHVGQERCESQHYHGPRVERQSELRDEYKGFGPLEMEFRSGSPARKICQSFDLRQRQAILRVSYFLKYGTVDIT